MEFEIAQRQRNLVGIELAAADFELAAEFGRRSRAGQCEPGLETTAGAVDLRYVRLEESDRVGIDGKVAGQRPAAPLGVGAVRGEVTLDQPGAAGVEAEAGGQLVLGQLGADQPVAEVERLGAAIGEVFVDGRVRELRIDRATPGCLRRVDRVDLHAQSAVVVGQIGETRGQGAHRQVRGPQRDAALAGLERGAAAESRIGILEAHLADVQALERGFDGHRGMQLEIEFLAVACLRLLDLLEPLAVGVVAVAVQRDCEPFATGIEGERVMRGGAVGAQPQRLDAAAGHDQALQLEPGIVATAAVGIEADLRVERIEMHALPVDRLQPCDTADSVGIVRVAVQRAMRLQFAVRAGMQQCQIVGINREVEIDGVAGAAIERDVGGAELQLHVMELPGAGVMCDVAMALGTLAAHAAAQVLEAGLELGLWIQPIAVRIELEADVPGDARPQAGDLEFLDMALQAARPARRPSAARLRGWRARRRL